VRITLALVPAAIFIFAARLLVLQFGSLRAGAVADAAGRWGGRLPLALVLCGLSFLVVGLIEWRALRWAKAPVRIGAALRVSFIANGLAHSLGATALVAGAVRARLYARDKVDLTTVATVTAFQAVTSGLGFATLAAIVALAAQAPAGAANPLIGGLMAAGVAAYVLACGLARGSLRLFGRSFELPAAGDALAQVGLGVLDNGLAMAAFWVLLPPGVVAYPRFVADYMLAYLGGALSGVPGGLGPFEGLMTHLLSSMDKAGLAAAFLGFRLVFYALPLALAGLLYLIELVRERRRPAIAAVSAGAGRPRAETAPGPRLQQTPNSGVAVAGTGRAPVVSRRACRKSPPCRN
jgi:uncharacterized membrane protein YbhN (UPF0104 family)